MIKLRPLQKEDLKDTLAWRNAPENHGKFRMKKTILYQDHLEWFLNMQKDQTQYVFAVLLDDKIIGQVSFYNWDVNNCTAEVGRFLINTKYQGKGYFTRAYTLLEKIMKESNIKLINIEVMVCNQKAYKIYKRLGYFFQKPTGDIIKGVKKIK
jgi:RimJ/RimL family protein N-acetyltransferase